MAAFPIADTDLSKSLQDRQQEMSRFRQMMAHLVEHGEPASVAMAPPHRRARKGG